MTVAVVDGMGGGIGEEIVAQIRKALSKDICIMALGTNAVATDKMMKARASCGASGENAIRVSINRADFIVGPIGIVMPDSMMGEITANIAGTIMNARGRKLLIPLEQSHVEIMGLAENPITESISQMINILKENI